MKFVKGVLPILLLLFVVTTLTAQFNYDESKVPDYQLPELLNSEKGVAIRTSEDWQKIRRPEILALFESQVYGKVPEGEVEVRFEVVQAGDALCGEAVRKEVVMHFSGRGKNLSVPMLIYLPKTSDGPVPLFLGLNFYGNHTIHPDDEIDISESWVRNNSEFCIFNNQADEVSRGVRSSRWPVERILGRGYGLATIYYGDIDPDFDDDFQNGIQPLFYQPGEKEPEADEWGSIAAWAWGLSRAMDYFEQDADIDDKRVAVLGHSRLGKTSLWAGAVDERFALVISNDSGCGGAAISRRKFGETVQRINTNFPHWFADNFNQYNDREETLPIDQHMLIALMAPRPVYVASARDDEWADPKGEFLSLYHAAPVYRLFGDKFAMKETQPAVNEPLVVDKLGYHIRSGGHDITRYDWERFMDFADGVMK